MSSRLPLTIAKTHLLSLLWDCLACILAACPLVLMVAPPAYAYVDPSVMTYTIQAVAGVAVALSAVLGVALRRTRKVIFRLFRIDENAKKVVEEPVVAIGQHSPDAPELLAEAEADARKDAAFLSRGPQPKRLKWPTRFFRAVLTIGFAVFTVFVVSPLEVVSASSGSLNFGFFEVAPCVAAVAGVAIAVAALALSFVRGRVFDAIVTVIVALGICAYVQALFLNESLPIADGRTLDLAEHMTITIISAVVWIAVIVIFLILNAKKKQACRALGLILSACLILVQGVSLASIVVDEQQKADEEVVTYVQTTQGLYDVSEDDNVIVFVLDFFDTQVLERIMDEDPDALEEFTGFTWYQNSTGSMVPTRYGMSFLLTGALPQDGDTWQDYIERRAEQSGFLEDIAAQGYDIGVYSDTVHLKDIASYASNYAEQSTIEIQPMPLVAVLDKVALYRDLPWILKPFFWFYTDEVNQASISTERETYVMDDVAYADKLRTDGLALNEEEKTFRLIHLIGAHYPFIMDAEGTASETETDIETQGHGSLMIVSEYLRELKRLGLYDDATIIVTADHGDWYITDEPLEKPTSPIFLVKPPESAEEAALPLKVSKIPTGHLDFHATIIDAVGGDASAYGPTVFDVQRGSRPRSYWMTGSDGTDDTFMLEFVIDGDVMNMRHWKETGRRIEHADE